jgi:hypothetical protein
VTSADRGDEKTTFDQVVAAKTIEETPVATTAEETMIMCDASGEKTRDHADPRKETESESGPVRSRPLQCLGICE